MASGGSKNLSTIQAGVDAVAKNMQGRITTAGTNKTLTDAQAVAQSIEQGLQPPEVKGLYGKSLAVKAQLQRDGFDLTKANKDWQAVQKWTASANSTSQLRMRQAENSVEGSLSKLQAVSDDFARTGFKFANKADLVAASNGALGTKAASQAQELLGQVSLVSDELGQTFMGGNSPTDAAFSLAKGVLSSDFTKAQMDTQIKLIQDNLQIRKNSWTNAGPVSEATVNNQPINNQTTLTTGGATYKSKTGNTYNLPNQINHD
jgi:hypothetical protein